MTFRGSYIPDGAVTEAKIAEDAVTETEIAEDAITSKHTIIGAKLVAGEAEDSGERIVIRPDGDGGIIEAFTGHADESPGYINSTGFSFGESIIAISPALNATYDRRPYFLLQNAQGGTGGFPSGPSDGDGGIIHGYGDRIGSTAYDSITMTAGDVGDANPGSIEISAYSSGVIGINAETVGLGGDVNVSGQLAFGTTFTANSGSIASGDESADIVVTHSLGAVPEIAVGHLEDGSWAHQFGWRKGSTWSSSQVSFRFKNHGPNTGTAVLRFKLVF